MFRSIFLFAGIAAALVVVAGTGCNRSDWAVNPALLAEHQARLVLAEEPDGVQTVLDVRETLLGESIETDDHDHDHADHADLDVGHDEHADEDHPEHEHEEEHAHHEGHDEEDAHEHEHEEVAQIEPTEPIDVLMVGTIGGLANPWEETQPDYPFTKNQASFFLADPGAIAELEASGHVHAPGEECAFCEAHAADSSALLAMVRFLDKNGQILPIGVPQMFDVEERDTVVIQGTARIVAGGMMVVDATGIYVRR
jgi:hypothetical protein